MRVALGTVLFFISTLYFSVSSFALEIKESPSSKPDSPLIMIEISIDKSRQLKYLQIYNNSNNLIDLSEYTLRHLDSSGEIIEQSNIIKSGYLEPDYFLLLAGEDIFDENNDLVLGLNMSTEVLNGDRFELKENSDQFNKNIVEIIDFEIDSRYSRYKSRAGNYTANTSFKILKNQDEDLYSDGVYQPKFLETSLINEILSNPNTCPPNKIQNRCADYIKLYNNQTYAIDLSGFRLRYGDPLSKSSASNTVSLDGLEIEPNEFININKSDVDSYINISSVGGYIWIEDKYGLVNYSNNIIDFPSSTSKPGLSWGKFDDGWGWSEPSPLADNIRHIEKIKSSAPVEVIPKVCLSNQFLNPQTNRCKKVETLLQSKRCLENQFLNAITNRCNKIKVQIQSKKCLVGYFLNPNTNRCKKLAIEKTAKNCQNGQFLNPETNRCKKIQTKLATKTCLANQFLNSETGRCKKIATLKTAKVTTPCKDGQYRSLETNRCRKIQKPKETKVCKENWELNPETNRCRKIRQSAGDMGEYKPSMKSEKEDNSMAILVFSGVGVVAVFMVIAQNREKLIRMIKGL